MPMNAKQTHWMPDKLLPGYESATLEFPPDYDGPVVATLVRKAGAAPRKRAVPYVHGFVDYFFQAHMAERFEEEGWSFYALDLRKHGRALLPGQHPCFCKHISEYFADIVLGWRSIAKWSPGLGRDVTVLQFPGGLHDLVLSKQEISEEVFAKLYPWLRARFP